MGSRSGLTASMPRRLAFFALFRATSSVHHAGQQCPGKLQMDGHGPVSLTSTGWNTSLGIRRVDISPTQEILTHRESRVYFADTCNDGEYDPSKYMRLNLLNKTLRYRSDLSGAGCGCNAAFYLTSMGHNPNRSECFDYYCDANNVCGESCAEIDIQEANLYAWHSTLHTPFDHGGYAAGYGGGVTSTWNGPRTWTPAEFGPDAKCIDSTKPIEVAVSFMTNKSGVLAAMIVTLSQVPHGLCSLSLILDKYDGMEELTHALKAGMTPIVSYWASNDMVWLDGVGKDNLGTCGSDDASKCPDSVKWSDFVVEDLREEDVAKARFNVQEQFNRHPTTSTSTTTANTKKPWWQQPTTTPWWASTAVPWWKRTTTTPWWASTAPPWWKKKSSTTAQATTTSQQAPGPVHPVTAPIHTVVAETNTTPSGNGQWLKMPHSSNMAGMHFAAKFGAIGSAVFPSGSRRWATGSPALLLSLALAASAGLALAFFVVRHARATRGRRSASAQFLAGGEPVESRNEGSTSTSDSSTRVADGAPAPFAANGKRSLAPAKPSCQALLEMEAQVCERK
jgi:hypothetical protein